MTYARAREKATGARKQELARLLKRVRDCEPVDGSLTEAVLEIASALKYGAVVEVCRALGRPEWIAPLAARNLDAIPEMNRRSSPVGSASICLESPEPPSAGPSPAAVTPDAHDHLGRANQRQFHTILADDVLQAHWALVEHFKRSRDPIDPPGVKSEDLLESAISRQHTGFAGVPKYKTLPHLAGALLYGLALNHPFHNGNKRTALLSLMLLLDKNDYVLTAREAELFDFVLRVVGHDLRPTKPGPPTALLDDEVRAIGSWVSAHCRRVDRRLRPIDWRELRRRLSEFGCETHVLKGNFIEISLGPKKMNLAYGGDDREVGKPTVLQIRRVLGLDEARVYDAAAFYGSGAPVDRFIVQYLDVFQRLAHA